jgi:hypothetical protein
VNCFLFGVQLIGQTLPSIFQHIGHIASSFGGLAHVLLSVSVYVVVLIFETCEAIHADGKKLTEK